MSVPGEIPQLRDGFRDGGALPQVREAFLGRLRRHARRTMRSNPRLYNYLQTDDLVQESFIALCKALEKTDPADEKALWGLCAFKMNQCLITLCRRYRPKRPSGAVSESQFDVDGGGDNEWTPKEIEAHTENPADLDMWTDFHEMAGELPEGERSIVQMLWYNGLTQEETARILGVHSATVRRHWNRIRCKIADKLIID